MQLDNLRIEISPEDYERLQRLRSRMIAESRDEAVVVAQLNFLFIQERVNNERTMQSVLRFSARDASDLAGMLERVRLSSAQMGDGHKPQQQPNVPTTPSELKTFVPKFGSRGGGLFVHRLG